jgi:hypothetical protein
MTYETRPPTVDSTHAARKVKPSSLRDPCPSAHVYQAILCTSIIDTSMSQRWTALMGRDKAHIISEGETNRSRNSTSICVSDRASDREKSEAQQSTRPVSKCTRLPGHPLHIYYRYKTAGLHFSRGRMTYETRPPTVDSTHGQR